MNSQLYAMLIKNFRHSSSLGKLSQFITAAASEDSHYHDAAWGRLMDETDLIFATSED